MPLTIALSIALAALVTALFSAIVGMGGGITLLGVMSLLLPAAQVVPLHGVVQLGSNCTRAVALLPNVVGWLVLRYAPFLVVGVLLATQVYSGDKLEQFRLWIGIFLLLFLFWRRKQPVLRNLPRWVYAPLGVLVGFLSIFVGATGPFTAPFFLRDDFSKEQVVATKAAVQTFGHLLKVPAFFVLGFDFAAHWLEMLLLLTAVVIGSLLGKRLLEHISERAFARLFEWTLASVAGLLILVSLFG